MDMCLNNRGLERLASKKATRVRSFPWWVKIKQGSNGQTQSEKQEHGARQIGTQLCLAQIEIREERRR